MSRLASNAALDEQRAALLKAEENANVAPKEQSLVSRLAEYLWLLPLLLVGLALRLFIPLKTNFVIDADEAIVGLMAKHILAGESWPIFYYGQAYMGSLEATLAALAFAALGQSSFALKLVPLVFSLLHISLIYTLARRFTTTAGALAATLVTAVGPSALMLWSGKARGGFIELVVLGTLALILSCDLLGAEKPGKGKFFALGLVLGLGWWVNNQIIFYLAPIGFVFCYHFFLTAGFKRALNYAMISALGFVVGGWPFWHANLFHEPRFQSLWLFRNAGGGEAMLHLEGYFTEAIPIITGARRFWSDVDLFPYATPLVYTLYALCLIVLTVCWARESKAAFRRRIELLVAFLVFVPLIFSLSQFGWLSQAPRYLLPLYSMLPILIGTAVGYLFEKRFFGRLLGLLTVCGFVGVHLYSSYANGGVIPGQPFLYRDDRVVSDQSQLYAELAARNYEHVETNYWIGYRAAFETDEALTFSRYRGPQVVRIPEYPAHKDPAAGPGPYVLSPMEADDVAHGFSALGLTFRRTAVGGYVIIDHIQPLVERGAAISIVPEQVFVSSRSDWRQNLVDGDFGSRWGSGAPQDPGMSIELRFDEPTDIVGLDLDYGFWLNDVPRDLTIEAQDVEGKWCLLFDTRQNRGLQHVLEGERKWELNFPQRSVQGLRFIQHGKHSIFDWSLGEVTIYSPNE